MQAMHLSARGSRRGARHRHRTHGGRGAVPKKRASPAASAAVSDEDRRGTSKPKGCLEGWMEKKGGLRPNWLKRWFVLRSDERYAELCYYETPERQHATLGRIALADVLEARPSQAPGAPESELEVCTEGRTYRCRASATSGGAAVARDAWVAALVQAVAAAKGAGGV